MREPDPIYPKEPCRGAERRHWRPGFRPHTDFHQREKIFRLDALHYAVDHAQEGDLIAVIGKGHETYRDREGVKTPFLERELLEEYAQQIGLE